MPKANKWNEKERQLYVRRGKERQRDKSQEHRQPHRRRTPDKKAEHNDADLVPPKETGAVRDDTDARRAGCDDRAEVSRRLVCFSGNACLGTVNSPLLQASGRYQGLYCDVCARVLQEQAELQRSVLSLQPTGGTHEVREHPRWRRL